MPEAAAIQSTTEALPAVGVRSFVKDVAVGALLFVGLAAGGKCDASLSAPFHDNDDDDHLHIHADKAHRRPSLKLASSPTISDIFPTNASASTAADGGCLGLSDMSDNEGDCDDLEADFDLVFEEDPSEHQSKFPGNDLWICKGACLPFTNRTTGAERWGIVGRRLGAVLREAAETLTDEELEVQSRHVVLSNQKFDHWNKVGSRLSSLLRELGDDPSVFAEDET